MREAAGRIDVLFANAGGGAITEAHDEDTFGRNVKGVLFTVQKALPLVAPGASVILTGSTAGTEGTEALSVYAASKAAVKALVRKGILDLKGCGIRMNALSPNATRAPGLVGLAGPEAARQQRLLDALASRTPMGRVGEADEIAKAALFLASDDASIVSGVALFVDEAKRRSDPARKRAA